MWNDALKDNAGLHIEVTAAGRRKMCEKYLKNSKNKGFLVGSLVINIRKDGATILVTDQETNEILVQGETDRNLTLEAGSEININFLDGFTIKWPYQLFGAEFSSAVLDGLNEEKASRSGS